jgi:multiple sugar transport system ATP-binding protein
MEHVKFTFGVRPENFAISESGIPAEVMVVEPTGSETQVFMRLGRHDFAGVFRERVKVGPKDTLRLTVDPAFVHIFDRQTGARI